MQNLKERHCLLVLPVRQQHKHELDIVCPHADRGNRSEYCWHTLQVYEKFPSNNLLVICRYVN